MSFRTVGADRLAFALLRLEPGDDPRPENEADQQRRHDRPARAKGDVAKQVQGVKLVGQRIQKIEHAVLSRRASPAKSAARRCCRGDGAESRFRTKSPGGATSFG